MSKISTTRRLIIAVAMAIAATGATTATADAMPRNPCQDYANQVRTSAYRDLAEAASGEEAMYVPSQRAGEPVEPMDDTTEGSGELDSATC